MKTHLIVLLIIFTLLGAAISQAQTSVTPGDSNFPVVFSSSDGTFSKPTLEGECTTSPGTSFSWSEGSTDGLLGGAFSFLGPSLTINPAKSKATLTQDFTVDKGASDSVLLSNIGVSFELQGYLAAVGNATATVHARLSLADTTNSSNGTIIASETLLKDEVSGKFSPSVGISGGVLLPAPDGKFSTKLSASIDGGYKVVDRTVNGGFDVLLQRGHTYRLVLELDTKAEVSYSGGLAMAFFLNESALKSGLSSNAKIDCFSNPIDLTDPKRWLEAGLEDVLAIPGLTFKLPAPAPGVDPATRELTAAPSESSNSGGANVTTSDLSFSLDGTVKTILKDVGAIDKDMGKLPGDFTTVDDTLGQILGGVQTLTTALSRDVSSVFSLAGLPAFTEKMSVGTLVDWLDVVAKDLEPAIAEGGLTGATLSIIVHHDLFDQASNNTTKLAKDISKSETAVKTKLAKDISHSETAVIKALGSSTTKLAKDISKSQKAIVREIKTRTKAILAALQANADADLVRDIEDKLAAGRCEFWMVTPKSLGGELTSVIDVIQSAIANVKKLKGLTSQNKRSLKSATMTLDIIEKTAAAKPLTATEVGELCTEMKQSYNCVMTVIQTSAEPCS